MLDYCNSDKVKWFNRSSAKKVPISCGFNICPRGFILSFEASSIKGAARLGVCTFCTAGTYSVNPLYGGGPNKGVVMEESESPKCLACPAGGICFGGDQVVQ